MKITTSSFTRFHMYEQARQLHKYGLLQQLITNYPRFITRKYGIPDKLVTALLYTGVIHRITGKLSRYLTPGQFNRIVEYLHNNFSKSVPAYINNDSDIFIGLSSFALEGIEASNKKGAISIVDHGSVHLKHQDKILNDEFELIGLRQRQYRIAGWIIDKEENEFHTARYVFLGSDFAKETFIKEGYNPQKLIVNNYGVTLKEFAKLPKADDVFRIIYCGGLTLAKGLHYLLKSVSKLNNKRIETWIIGGTTPDAPLRAAFKAFNIKMENIYFKGTFPQNELYKIYSQGSVFILPSLADGFAMVVPQALACGLPVIVTENTGARDIVKEGYNGFVVPIRNTEKLCEKIQFLYENPKICEEMSGNAIASVANGLTWDDYGNRLVNNLTKFMELKSDSSA